MFPAGEKDPYGFLVMGVNPYRLPDDKYLAFLSLVGDQVATSFADIHVLEVERRRAEALAEIDRAKTTFFSNISHGFRTPLTLLLSPLEELLNEPGDWTRRATDWVSPIAMRCGCRTWSIRCWNSRGSRRGGWRGSSGGWVLRG